jgi:hypothetical protein
MLPFQVTVMRQAVVTLLFRSGDVANANENLTKQTSFCVKLLPLLPVINIFSRKKKPNAFSGQTMALGGGKGSYIVSCVTFLLELEVPSLFFFF